jgi:hypothetical protein
VHDRRGQPRRDRGEDLARDLEIVERGRVAAVIRVGDECTGAKGAADLVGTGVGGDTEQLPCATAVHGHLVLE